MFNAWNVDLLPLQQNDSIVPIACYGCTVCCLATTGSMDMYSSTQEGNQMLAGKPEVKKPSGGSGLDGRITLKWSVNGRV
jgi:hypothetical protein